MPDAAASPAQAVLEALGFVLFTRNEAGELHSLGKTPAWLRALWPPLATSDSLLPVAEASPFLENFLVDAEECWQKGGAARVRSGPWVEQDPSGSTVQLEATAMTLQEQKLLLLARLGEEFEVKKSVLQRARETVIAHQRLNSEIQKKEILLHCVADEMTAALANAITALRLIELEDNGPRTKQLLGLAMRATHEQQTLIHRILAVFEEELRSVYRAGAESEARANWNAVLDSALATARPFFAEKGVKLEAPDAKEIPLALEPAQLERVIGNLLENALQRSSPGQTVIVRAKDEPETLEMSVEDSGPLMPNEVCENLFTRWDPAQTTPASALRLHFCRIVAENSGGEIGCVPLPGGGCRFWIRLTKSNAPA